MTFRWASADLPWPSIAGARLLAALGLGGGRHDARPRCRRLPRARRRGLRRGDARDDAVPRDRHQPHDGGVRDGRGHGWHCRPRRLRARPERRPFRLFERLWLRLLGSEHASGDSGHSHIGLQPRPRHHRLRIRHEWRRRLARGPRRHGLVHTHQPQRRRPLPRMHAERAARGGLAHARAHSRRLGARAAHSAARQRRHRPSEPAALNQLGGALDEQLRGRSAAHNRWQRLRRPRADGGARVRPAVPARLGLAHRGCLLDATGARRPEQRGVRR